MNRPISTRTHAMMGYVTGVLLILAPWIFGFADNGGAAVKTPIIIGVILLISELIANSGLSLSGMVPMRIHLMGDMLAGLVLAASPWLFGFHNQGTNAWLPHLVAGIFYIVVAAMTQTVPSEASSSRHAHA